MICILICILRVLQDARLLVVTRLRRLEEDASGLQAQVR